MAANVAASDTETPTNIQRHRQHSHAQITTKPNRDKGATRLYSGTIYLHFTDRQIVTVNHFAWWETSKRRRPLTDFSNIVVRHLCHPGGEAPDTYTGSVGLKPVDGRAVLWVKSFPTTQDEVLRTTHEFARKLKEMTGLPGAATAEFKNETHRN